MAPFSGSGGSFSLGRALLRDGSEEGFGGVAVAGFGFELAARGSDERWGD